MKFPTGTQISDIESELTRLQKRSRELMAETKELPQPFDTLTPAEISQLAMDIQNNRTNLQEARSEMKTLGRRIDELEGVQHLTPAQLLDQQIDLLIRLQQPNSVLKDIIYSTLLGNSAGDKMARASADYMAANVENAIKAAEAFYVTRDLRDEVVRRSEDQEFIPGIRAFDRNDAPVGSGFLYVEGGLPIREIRGRIELAHWIIWAPSQTGDGKSVICFWFFNDSRQMDEVAITLTGKEELWVNEQCGRFLFQSADVSVQGKRLGAPQLVLDDEQAEKLRKEQTAEDGPPIPEGDIWWTNRIRLMVALWDMLNETVAVVTHGDAMLNRGAVRRARRMNLPGRVTVVKLRRSKSVDSDYLGPKSVDWSHRWIRRRHRRMQPCGPNGSERKLIWIEATVCGPADKPLVQSQKVYRLDR